MVWPAYNSGGGLSPSKLDIDPAGRCGPNVMTGQHRTMISGRQPDCAFACIEAMRRRGLLD
jgi:hypothetical protein